MESHCGDAPESYGTYDWPCDKKAKEELEKICKMKSNSYSTFTMERIDVDEKTTYIS
jgi:endonuclease YncB( thermonuclease family)